MASVWFVFLLPLLCVGVRAQLGKAKLISLNSSLSPKNGSTSWASPSGLFGFGFYPQGNGFSVGIWLVGTPENTVVWTANRDDPPASANAKLYFTGDGRLLLQTEGGSKISITDGSGPAVAASMLDSGSFVLYDRNLSVMWNSFDDPTDTILGGQDLYSDNEMVSSESRSNHSSGRFFLSMQSDGNLVSYPVNSSGDSDDSYWSTATTSEMTELHLNTKGHLYLSYEMSSIIKTLWNSSDPSKNMTTIYRATLDPDGIFRLYSHRFENNGSSTMSTVWSSLSDQCDVKGFCGFNSYCSGPGTKAECRCLPGFDFNNPSEKIRGCSRIFKGDDCRMNNQMMSYNITTIENTGWGDYPYYKKSMKMEECGRLCLDDCNCGAALFPMEIATNISSRSDMVG